MTWTEFDPLDSSTWPPAERLVLIAKSGYLGLRSFEYEEGDGVTVSAYDEGNDYDDGLEDGDLFHWHPLPDSPLEG